MFRFLKKSILTNEVLELIEDELILADLGIELTNFVIKELKKTKLAKEVSLEEVKLEIINILTKRIEKNIKPFQVDYNKKPFVILVSGTNGSGKTTSIAKLSFNLKQLGLKVLLAPCDTFRAGATNQLRIWSERIGVDFFTSEAKDPAAIAYQAIDKAQKQALDIVIIDTAGRLDSNKNLMLELQKINNTIKKLDESYPNESILVVDGTIGQAAFLQAKSFNEIVSLSGFITSKLDSSAKAGVLINIAANLNISPFFLGKGEKEEDLEIFNLEKFLKRLLQI